MTLAEIQQLIILAHKIGTKKLTYKDLSIEFADQPNPFTIPKTNQSLQEDRQPTEDELLFWSTDYQPDIKASAPE